MIISALKEVNENEKRVAMTPDSINLFQRLLDKVSLQHK